MTDGTKVRVLLVEDSPGDAKLVARYLEAVDPEGFKLVHVDRLKEAFLKLKGQEFDVVLLDPNLPDAKEPSSIEQMCQEAPELPIVVLTGQQDRSKALDAVRQGAQDYLMKAELGAALLDRAIRYAIERHRVEEALRESRERFALAVSGSHDGIWDWNLETDEIYLAPRWKEMLGYKDEDISSRPREWFDRVHAEDLDALQHDIVEHLNGTTGHFENEHRVKHRDGDYRWVLARGIAVRQRHTNVARRMGGSLTDIHQRKGTEEQLLHDALHDGLTGLPNWSLFMDRLMMAMASSQRATDSNFAVLFLDLDRFKNVNDSLGHAVGDRLLIATAERLRGALRPGDTVARLGGDEFVILALNITSPQHATRIAERIHSDMKRPFAVGGHEVFATVSMGIALSSDSYKDPEDILRDADTAMYRAKSAGRAKHAIFDTDMHRSAVKLLQLENDLRRAVERDEFALHYQPIVSLATGGLEGFEALLRWQHPSRGIVLPADFISVAEDTGLIMPIGDTVLKNACGQMARWHDRFPESRRMAMSVNLSARQFAQEDLVDSVSSALSTSGLDPELLRLEITESMIMDSGDGAIARINRLRDLGCHLHIDDFGTGYCSLSYLHRVPTQTLKIDRSFIQLVNGDSSKSQIIGTIVAMARNLGMHVSAEGLETAEQLARVRELECEFGQGYYFSRPLAESDAINLIESHHHW